MYTIKIKDIRSVDWLAAQLQRVIDGRRSRFTAEFTVVDAGTIHVKPVRLREKKLYCGQHPGECFIGPRRSGRWLEWDDWVEFHGLVNAELDRLKVNADVWTNPPERMDKGRKMWVRRGLLARKRWDYEVDHTFRFPVATWNHGTEDQFA